MKLRQKNSLPAVYSGSPVSHCDGENEKYAQEKEIPDFPVQTFVDHLLWQELWQSVMRWKMTAAVCFCIYRMGTTLIFA